MQIITLRSDRVTRYKVNIGALDSTFLSFFFLLNYIYDIGYIKRERQVASLVLQILLNVLYLYTCVLS